MPSSFSKKKSGISSNWQWPISINLQSGLEHFQSQISSNTRSGFSSKLWKSTSLMCSRGCVRHLEASHAEEIISFNLRNKCPLMILSSSLMSLQAHLKKLKPFKKLKLIVRNHFMKKIRKVKHMILWFISTQQRRQHNRAQAHQNFSREPRCYSNIKRSKNYWQKGFWKLRDKWMNSMTIISSTLHIS